MKSKWFFSLLVLIEILPLTTQAITFPQIAMGGGYRSRIMASNKTNVQWCGCYIYGHPTLAPPNLCGSSIPTDWMPYIGRFCVPPNGEYALVVGDPSGPVKTDYLEIVGQRSQDLESSIAVAFFYEYVNTVTGEVIDSTGSRPAVSSRKFLFPVDRRAIPETQPQNDPNFIFDNVVDTGMAWVTASAATDFHITASLYEQYGTLVARKTVPYSGHLLQFFTEFFDVPLDPVGKWFIGSVLVESEQPLYLEVLRMTTRQDGRFLLTSTPPDSYVP